MKILEICHPKYNNNKVFIFSMKYSVFNFFLKNYFHEKYSCTYYMVAMLPIFYTTILMISLFYMCYTHLT